MTSDHEKHQEHHPGQPQPPQPPVVASAPNELVAPQHVDEPRGFLNGMSVYGLEFAVAMIMLFIMVSVLSGLVYALFGYLNDQSSAGIGGYATLWFAASAIVWLPILLIFYARSRGYMLRKPAVTNDTTQRVFVIMYQVLTMIIGISFAVATVYTLFIALTQPSETGSILITGTVPGLISTLFSLYAFFAFYKRPVISRKVYTSLLLTLTLLIIIPSIIVSIISLRNYNENRGSNRSTQREYRYDSNNRYDSNDSYNSDDRYY